MGGAVTNWYCTLELLRARIGLTDSGEDAILRGVIQGVSDRFNKATGRFFYVRNATSHVTARASDRLLLRNDLLSVTTLATDSNGDLSYATEWQASDYLLLPDEAPLRDPPEPYWEIRVAPGGSLSFPTSLRGVELVGRWGYYEVLERSPSLLNGSLDVSTRTVIVDDGADFGTGQTILIGDEQMWIDSISSDTLTVTRGVNGTMTATHADDSAIDIYTYPDIGEACLEQSEHSYHATKAVGGVIGGDQFGPVRMAALQPNVRQVIQSYKYKSV